jgi:hypothetical protein
MRPRIQLRRSRPLTGPLMGLFRDGAFGIQHCVLGQGELLYAFTVVDLCRRLKAIGPVAKENPVEIQLENLLLVQRSLYLDGQQNLVELAHERALERQEIIAGHLHGQRAAAGALLSSEHQFGYRAHQAHEVDARVAEKIIILCGQKCIYKLLWNGVKGQGASLLLSKLTDQLAVPGVNPHRCLQFYIAQRFDVRQIGAQIQVDTGKQPQAAEKAKQCEA